MDQWIIILAFIVIVAQSLRSTLKGVYDGFLINQPNGRGNNDSEGELARDNDVLNVSLDEDECSFE